jgi:hypothetical protein
MDEILALVKRFQFASIFMAPHLSKHNFWQRMPVEAAGLNSQSRPLRVPSSGTDAAPDLENDWMERDEFLAASA